MKRYLFGMPMMAIVVMVSIFCSCGNKTKPVVDEQAIRDSIEKHLKDSLAGVAAEKAKLDSIVEYKEIHSKEVVEKSVKEFLSEYVNTCNDNIEKYLSADFKRVIKKCNEKGYEFNLFGLNSSSNIERYTILSIVDVNDKRATVRTKLFIECEGDYNDEITIIYLTLENGKWLVDEIGDVKKTTNSDLKHY